MKYRDIIVADNPTAYYQLDEVSGTFAKDSSGNGNNGTIASGCTLYQPGALVGDNDTSILFNGTTSGRITLPVVLNAGTWNQMSFECWFNFSTASLGGFTQIVQGDNTNLFKSYQMFWSGTTALSFKIGNGTIQASAAKGSLTATSNTWVHTAGTYDGAFVRLYINGVLVATSSAITGPIGASVAIPTIGSNTSGNLPFPGWVDEVAIYQYALSAAQVFTHYSAGIGNIADNEYGAIRRSATDFAFGRLSSPNAPKIGRMSDMARKVISEPHVAASYNSGMMRLRKR